MEKRLKCSEKSHVEEAAREMNVPVLGRMPIDMKLAEAVENEKFYEAENPYWQMSSYKKSSLRRQGILLKNVFADRYKKRWKK